MTGAGREVTPWTIATGILLAAAIIVGCVAVWFSVSIVWDLVGDAQERGADERRECEAENDRWRERGVPERVREC